MSSAIVRPKPAATKIGVGDTKFHEDFVDRGGDDPEDRFVPGTDKQVKRLRPVPLGERAVGFFSDEIDRLIEQLREWRDATPRAPREPAVDPEFHPSRHRKRQKQSGRQLPAAR
jgi:hypothetical protein